MKKIAFISLAAIMTSLAASADTIVTSKTYVDNRDNLKQNAITAGTAGSLVTYVGTTTTNGGANLGEQAVFSSTTASSYNSTNDASKIPTMGAVMAQISNSASGVLPSATANQVLQYNATSSAWESTTMDSAPTSASVKPVTSGGVYTAVDAKQNKLDANNATTYPNGSLVAYGTTAGTPTAKKIVTTVAQNGTDIPTDGAVYTAVSGKQDNLGGGANADKVVTATSTAGTVTYTAIDTTPTQNSTNLITSGAVYSVKSQVDALANCTHTCASSDPTNHSDWCDLITINCVNTASNSQS